MEELNGLSIAFSSALKGLRLNYIAGKETDFTEVDSLLQRLKHINLLQLRTDDDKKAFWINIYNGLSNYIIVKKKIKRTIIFNYHSFPLFSINIGDYQWNLNHIEHGILRKNAIPPKRICKAFSNSDPRRKHILKVKDNRIHFALNTGDYSSPSVRFYNSESIDQELDEALQLYLLENVEIDEINRTILCSPLFQWYRKDFEGKYVYDRKYKGFKIDFSQFNWSLHLRGTH